MTNPQLEDGFTRIANELFEAVMLHGFTQRQLLILLAIIRKTYGYGKKEDDMSASQIGALCKISRNHATETVNQLFAMNVLTKKEGRYGQVIGVNKKYSEWTEAVRASSPKSGLVEVVPSRDTTSPKSGRVDSPKSGHTKENLSKETIKRKVSGKTSLPAYLLECEQSSRKPIPEDDAVFEYAEKIGLPAEFLRLQWLEFKERRSEQGAKKQASWPQTFRNSVKENWFGLWYLDGNGQYLLTTKGQQAKRNQREAA